MLVRKVTLFVVAVVALFAFTACGHSRDEVEELPPSKAPKSAQNPTQSESSTSLASEHSTNQSVEKEKSEARSSQITKSEEKQVEKDENMRKRSYSNEGLQVTIDGKKANKKLDKKIIVKARKGLTLSDALQDTNLIQLEKKGDDQKEITSVAGVKGDWEIKVNGKVVTDLELDITLQSGDQIELLLNK